MNVTHTTVADGSILNLREKRWKKILFLLKYYNGNHN